MEILIDKHENDRLDMSPDKLRVEKDKDHMERKSCTKDKIYLGKVRATDLPSNKDLMMPRPASIKEEIEIQTVMSTYMETLESFM